MSNFAERREPPSRLRTIEPDHIMDASSGEMFTSCHSACSRQSISEEEATPSMPRQAGAHAIKRPHTARRVASTYAASTASSKAKMASTLPAPLQQRVNFRANKDRHSKQSSSVLRSTAPSRLQNNSAHRTFHLSAQEQHQQHNSAPLPTLSNTPTSKRFLGDSTPRPQQPVSYHDDVSASSYTARSPDQHAKACHSGSNQHINGSRSWCSDSERNIASQGCPNAGSQMCDVTDIALVCFLSFPSDQCVVKVRAIQATPAPLQPLAEAYMHAARSQGGATDASDDFCFSQPGPPPEAERQSATAAHHVSHDFAASMPHSVSPLETSFSLESAVPAATGRVASPPLPQDTLSAGTPVASNATAATAGAAHSVPGWSPPSENTHSITLQKDAFGSNIEEVAADGPESSLGANARASGDQMARTEFSVAGSHTRPAVSADSSGRHIPRSPVPPLRLPLRTRMAAHASEGPQMQGMHAYEESELTPPPAPRSPQQQALSQQHLFQRAASARPQHATAAAHHLRNRDATHVLEATTSTCSVGAVSGERGSHVQQLRPASAPMRGVPSNSAGAHGSSLLERECPSPASPSPSVALIVSSLSPQPRTGRGHCTDDSTLGLATSDSRAQSSIRHSGDLFDASAHASGAGSSRAQGTHVHREGDWISASTSHACVHGDPASSTKSRKTSDPRVGTELSSSMRAAYEREMQAGGIASEAPASGLHGAAFVRRELFMRSEEQTQREIDALFEGNVEALLDPSLDAAPLGEVQLPHQPPVVGSNTAELMSSGEGGPVLPDRNRTWTGASSTLTGLVASEWSLEGSSHTSEKLVSQAHEQEVPTMHEEDTLGSSAALPPYSHTSAKLVPETREQDAPATHEEDTVGSSVALTPHSNTSEKFVQEPLGQEAPATHEDDTHTSEQLVPQTHEQEAPAMHEDDTVGSSVALPPYFDCTLVREPFRTVSRAAEVVHAGVPLQAAVAQPVAVDTLTYLNATGHSTVDSALSKLMSTVESTFGSVHHNASGHSSPSQQSSTSDLFDTVDGVEFNHVHHRPSLSRASSSAFTAPPSLSPSRPVSSRGHHSATTSPEVMRPPSSTSEPPFNTSAGADSAHHHHWSRLPGAGFSPAEVPSLPLKSSPMPKQHTAGTRTTARMPHPSFDAAADVEFSHHHHSPSLSAVDSSFAAVPPLPMKPSPMAKQHPDPAANRTVVDPKNAPKTAPENHGHSSVRDVDCDQVNTIPSEDVTFATFQLQRSKEVQDKSGYARGEAGSGTLSTVHGDTGLIEHNDSGGIACGANRRSMDYTWALVCAAEAQQDTGSASLDLEPLPSTFLDGQRLPVDSPEAVLSRLLASTEHGACTRDSLLSTGQGASSSIAIIRSGNEASEHIGSSLRLLDASEISGFDDVLGNYGHNITRIPEETAVSGGTRETAASPGAVSGGQQAELRTRHEHALMERPHNEAGCSTSAAELQHDAFFVAPRQASWEVGAACDKDSSVVARPSLPPAAAGIRLRSTSDELDDIARSTRRHPVELEAASSALDRSMALAPYSEEFSTGRSGELLNSQAREAVVKLRHQKVKLRSAKDLIVKLQDSVEYLKNEVASCNHERDLVDRLVATRQELKAAQLHSKRTAAAGHSQAAELFDWAWHLQACLEAKQHESKATKNAFGALKAEMTAVQTALTAAKQFEAVALSHHGAHSVSHVSVSNTSSPCALSSPAAPSELPEASPDSGTYTARSAYTARSPRVAWTEETNRYQPPQYAPSTAPSVARSNFSAWTDGGALLDQSTMLELKRQRDAAVQQAAAARAKLERTKSAAAVNAHTASFYQAYSQDREALYQAQHKSYCKLSDTFMQQMRAASASASVHRQRRAQSARHPIHAVEASTTASRGASGHRLHTGLHTQPEHQYKPYRDTSKDYLIEEALSSIYSPREVVFRSRAQGRLQRTGSSASGRGEGHKHGQGSYTLQYHRKRVLSPTSP